MKLYHDGYEIIVFERPDGWAWEVRNAATK